MFDWQTKGFLVPGDSPTAPFNGSASEVIALCAHWAHNGSMTKDERLTVRVTHEQLELFRDAAELQGQTVSDFAITTLTSKAHDVMAERRVFRISGERWNELISRLDERPVVRPNLADALRTHAKRVAK